MKPFPVIRIEQEYFLLSTDETMGSKSKFWFKHPEWGDCLFKFSRLNTGEDWAEKFAAELSNLLSLPHADYDLAETWDGRVGIVSRNFLPTGGTLVHGNEILSPLIPNYPTYATYGATQHTITIVLSAIQNSLVSLPPGSFLPVGIETAADLFVGYLLLDAWIGNGDRHHENWGFVRCRKKSQEGNALYLAPTYDHASSLGRELTDEKRQVRSVEAYAKKCVSAFYDDGEGSKLLTTFDLFLKVANLYPHAAEVWLGYLEKISTEQIGLILKRFPRERLSEVSSQFIQKILDFNQKRLLSLKNDNGNIY